MLDSFTNFFFFWFWNHTTSETRKAGTHTDGGAVSRKPRSAWQNQTALPQWIQNKLKNPGKSWLELCPWVSKSNQKQFHWTLNSCPLNSAHCWRSTNWCHCTAVVPAGSCWDAIAPWRRDKMRNRHTLSRLVTPPHLLSLCTRFLFCTCSALASWLPCLVFAWHTSSCTSWHTLWRAGGLGHLSQPTVFWFWKETTNNRVPTEDNYVCGSKYLDLKFAITQCSHM